MREKTDETRDANGIALAYRAQVKESMNTTIEDMLRLFFTAVLTGVGIPADRQMPLLKRMTESAREGISITCLSRSIPPDDSHADDVAAVTVSVCLDIAGRIVKECNAGLSREELQSMLDDARNVISSV